MNIKIAEFIPVLALAIIFLVIITLSFEISLQKLKNLELHLDSVNL